MSIKKIVASAGIAAGALAAMAGTASASPLPAVGLSQLPQVDPVAEVGELGERVGIAALQDFGGPNAEVVHNGTALLQG
ncbi:hypothetical protein BBK82_14235 [Lentzea guizhouensis]|uniref:Secreted protein n=1 Tax=Lentzea guizhouensis TaxID=1586287 RepID=A0A1B2HH59_9PSEU|nr:hypothetical protein [Lentzea guizhouensis]ANZ37056.1 hypothetical protein BBK82_14235 [Lentzea guizhouensis]